MLDHVEEDDDVEAAELGERRFIGHAGDDAKALPPCIGGGVRRDLDPGHLEISPCFLQEKPIGTADVEQPSAGLDAGE